MGELWLFGYGSLLFAPELPDAIVERRPARLEGWHRSFNKRSHARGCAEEEARHPRVQVPAFAADGWRWSLALGTAPGGALDGVALRYDPAVREPLLARMHRREGWAPDRPAAHNGYLPTEVQVVTGGGPLRAWTWLSNPGGRFHVELAVDAQARVLVHATPRADDGRGVDYLARVRAAAPSDLALERLWAAVQAVSGR